MSSIYCVVDDFLSLLSYMRDQFFRPAEKIARCRLSPAQFHALSILYRKGPLPVSEFARKMTISKQQSTPLICKLIESGLAARRTDEHDRRIVLLEITASGRETLEGLQAELRQAFAARLDALPDEELHELERMIRRIREILQEIM